MGSRWKQRATLSPLSKIVYHLQTHVISKYFELQQQDCAQMEDLSKLFKKPLKFFELFYQKAALWGILGGWRLLLGGRINFDSFSKTWKFFAPKISMKYSENGQILQRLKAHLKCVNCNFLNTLRTPHRSCWSRSKFTFFCSTLYN